MSNSRAKNYAAWSIARKAVNKDIDINIKCIFGISANYIDSSYLFYNLYSQNGLSIVLQLTSMNDDQFLVSIMINERMSYKSIGSDYIELINLALQDCKLQVNNIINSIDIITKHNKE